MELLKYDDNKSVLCPGELRFQLYSGSVVETLPKLSQLTNVMICVNIFITVALKEVKGFCCWGAFFVLLCLEVCLFVWGFFTLFFSVGASAIERSHLFQESELADTNSEHIELSCSTQKYP